MDIYGKISNLKVHLLNGGGDCSDKNNGIGTEFKIYIDNKDYEMRNTQMYSRFS